MDTDDFLTYPVCGGKVKLDEDGTYNCTKCYAGLTMIDGKLEIGDD